MNVFWWYGLNIDAGFREASCKEEDLGVYELAWSVVRSVTILIDPWRLCHILWKRKQK